MRIDALVLGAVLMFAAPAPPPCTSKGFTLKGGTYIEADIQGNRYVLRGNEISKFGPDGVLVARFSQPEYGPPDRIDASDPLRILVHYRRFQKIVWLDNRLNPLGNELATEELGMADVSCAALSDQWRIWMYDQTRDELILYDANRREGVFRSPSLTQLLGTENKVLGLAAGVDRVLLATDRAWVEFDRFGGLVAQHPESGLGKVIQQGGVLWMGRSQAVFRSNRPGQEAQFAFALPRDCRDWAVSPGCAHLLFTDRIETLALE
ncbi:hypothetical protein GC167_10360 [bacterium]|nr:hypothetical protein [bacterium]